MSCGAWLSLVEHCFREAVVGGSNPLAPTKKFDNYDFYNDEGAMLKKKERIFRVVLLVSLIFCVIGCATSKEPVDPQDPYEHFNRKVFAFNIAFDRVLFRPVAKTYDTILPWPVKKGVHNFFDNVGDVVSAANEILQLAFPQAIADLARVVINTIVGIGGLFDIATLLGVEKNIGDFGLTLARWGSKDTPYMVLPFFGPATVRDAIALPINYFLLSPWGYLNSQELQYITAGLYFVQSRSELLIGDKVVEQAFDPYVFVRDAYLQHRRFLIEENNARHSSI
jgi:phospholipid-binding lipoprotein MlaA